MARHTKWLRLRNPDLWVLVRRLLIDLVSIVRKMSLPTRILNVISVRRFWLAATAGIHVSYRENRLSPKGMGGTVGVLEILLRESRGRLPSWG